MPEPPNWIPLDDALVSDLKRGRQVLATCVACGHQGEVTVTVLRMKRDPSTFVTRLGHGLRCTRCNHRGATVDARHALGHFG